MSDKINVQSGRLEYVSSTGTLDVIIHGDLNVIGNSGSTDVTQGSLQVRDVSLITNFGEFGPNVTTGDNISGLLVDRGMYSLVKLPDPSDPDSFPSVFIWEVEVDSSGNALLRSDPSAHPGWQFPSGDSSDATGGTPDVTLPVLTSPVGLTWSESSFSWDLNYDYLAGDDPAPLPINPRITNLGSPINDADVNTAANVQWVADKIDEFQNVTLPAEVTLENLANVEDSSPVLGNFLAYSGTEWISTNTVEGPLRLENSAGSEFIEIDPTTGVTIDTGISNSISATGDLPITSTGDLILQGTTFPSSPGTTGQILILNGTDLVYGDISNTITAGAGLVKSGTTSVTLDVGAGTGIIVNANDVQFDETYGDARYLGINTKAADSELLDGLDSSYFLNASNLSSGILPSARFNDTSHGNRAGGSLHAVATTGSAGFMSAADKTNLDALVASPNQNAFSNIAVSGQSTVSADNPTDTVNFVAGSGITLTTDAGTDTVTITSTVSGGVSSVSAGNGLVGGGTGAVTLDVGAGDGITVNANDIAVNSTVVRTTGTQTIAGNKTLTGNTSLSSSGSSSPLLTLSESVGNTIDVRFVGDAGDVQSLRLRYEAADGLLLEPGYALIIESDGVSPVEQAHLEVEGNIYSGGFKCLTTNDTGINADTLDNLDSTNFIRSDVNAFKTGDLIFQDTWGISLPTANSQPSKSGGNYITPGAAGASATASNLTLHSFHGIGFASTISGQTIPQGENAVYIDIREGDLFARGSISEGGTALSSKYLGISATAANTTRFNNEFPSFYRNASNLNAGILSGALFNDSSHGSRSGGTLHAVATTSVAGFMSSSDKTKLDGISSGAQVNQNAFSNIAVSGEGTIQADTTTDTLTIAAGTGISLTTDPVTDTLTITSTATSGVSSITAGNGLTGGGSGAVTLDVGAGDGITVNANDIAVNSTVVRTTGTQTIAGAKTFSDTTSFNGLGAFNNGVSVVTEASEYLDVTGSFASPSIGKVRITGTGFGNGAGNLFIGETLSTGGGIGFTATAGYLGDIPVDGLAIYRLSGGTPRWTARQVSVNDNWVFRGSVTATSFPTSSALKYKKEILPFEDSLDKIKEIDVITYKRVSEDDDDKRYLGVTAESTATVLPEVVIFDDDGNPDSVSYAQMSALAVKAIQEQQVLIKQQETHIKSLESEIAAIKKHLGLN
jgi:hypothetical protein